MAKAPAKKAAKKAAPEKKSTLDRAEQLWSRGEKINAAVMIRDAKLTKKEADTVEHRFPGIGFINTQI